MKINERAWQCCQTLDGCADALRVRRLELENGAAVWDFGVTAVGGLAAGLMMARVCLADLAQIQLTPGDSTLGGGPAVMVSTDQPLIACMASQYAGWKIQREKFFAMGSGPMRSVWAREPLFDRLAIGETADWAVGVLETAALPDADVAGWIAEQCGVQPNRLCLLAARTASQAGTVQIVARSVETALHKLLDLDFDLHRVVSGWGVAPLPPVAADDLTGIGRTNDAILYGATVTLWVRGDDASLAELVPRVPSCASSDFGQPFRDVFAQYDHDFYKIDPHLFSPAAIRLVNLETGGTFEAGQVRPDILRSSFLESTSR